MTVIRWFRRLVLAIEALTACLGDLVRTREELGPALERLDALERSRAQFEAEMQGMLLKADGKLKAASNAEARERQLKKSYEKQLDSFDPDGETAPEAVRSVDAQPSEAEEVPAMRVVVAPAGKAAAIVAKWR